MTTAIEPGVPRWGWWTAAGIAVGAITGLTIRVARGSSNDILLARTGAPTELRTLAALQRYTESRGNPKAGLGQLELFPSWAQPRNAPRSQQVAESEAAMHAYERNRDAYKESPYPRRMWIFGSGGLYGLIPADALAPFRNTDALRLGKVTPYDVFNRWRSTVLFVDYVRRLTQRPEFRAMREQDRNTLALKRGLAKPSLAWDVSEEFERSRTVRRSAIEAANALGIDESELYRPIPIEWPNYPGALELLT